MQFMFGLLTSIISVTKPLSDPVTLEESVLDGKFVGIPPTISMRDSEIKYEKYYTDIFESICIWVFQNGDIDLSHSSS